jgi:hypothetical protein
MTSHGLVLPRGASPAAAIVPPRPPRPPRLFGLGAPRLRDLSNTVEYPNIGQVSLDFLTRAISYAGRGVKTKVNLKEIGIFACIAHRPVWADNDPASGVLLKMLPFWLSITHNERVDVGAAIQFNRVFGTSGTTANGIITALAVATTGFTTKTKTDLSIGSASANVTTNEFTGSGLARAAGTVSTYGLPASLGATASQLVTLLYTASGSATAHGGAVFDQVAVSGSHLYVEDQYSSDATLVTNDTLTQNVTINN